MSKRRCEACEAPIELDDECYECQLAQHNAGRTTASARVRCKHGHEWTEENTRLILHRGKYVRQCRTCDRERCNAYYKSKGHLLKKERYDKSKQE